MVSIVIRNKNESQALSDCLELLQSVYSGEFDEIIVVDNLSTDNSVMIAKEYGCKVITIEHFTYGRALNLGIEASKNKYVLLLSAHAVPVGTSFFKSSCKLMEADDQLAGLRYINSFSNYRRAVENDFRIENGGRFGLMAACALIRRSVWEEFRFDETLVASEDKDWSRNVIAAGYSLNDHPETYFYFAERSTSGALKRWEIETLAHYQVNDLEYPGRGRLLLSYLYKIFIRNPLKLFKWFRDDTIRLIRSFGIKRKLGKRRNRS